MASRRKNPLDGDPTHAWQPGWDYSDCEWVWLWDGPRPTPVEHMVVDRAFKSFGLDSFVMKNRWTRSIRTPGGTMTEAQYFCNKPDDICCADTVGFCAFQTGVVDFLLNMWVHHVNGYFPGPWNADKVRLVGVYKPNQVPPTDKLLPGDYFLYIRPWESPHTPEERIALGNAHAADVNYADHINMYIGPFAEKGDDGKLIVNGQPGIRHFINGSLTTIGTSMFVLPISMDGVLAYEYGSNNTTIVHGRFKAIEQLYGALVGPPLRGRVSSSSASGGAASPADDIDAFWEASRVARAPYPVGGKLSWHQGVHVQAKAGDEVLSIAPGEIVAARIAAAKPMPEGDASFVLVRHLFAPKTMTFVNPKDIAELKTAGTAVPELVPAFSLSMHLAPVDGVLGPVHDGDPVPPLTDAAPPWLAKLWPAARPHDLIPAGTPMVVLAPKDGGASPGYVALGNAPRLELGSDVALGADHKALAQVDVGGVPHYLVPQGADAHLDVWADHPAAPPAKGALCFFNALASSVVKTTHDVGKSAHYLVKEGADGLSLAIHTVDGVDYAEIDAFTRPGIVVADKARHVTARVLPDDGGNDVVVLSEKAKRLVLYLDTSGQDDVRFFPDQLEADVDVAQLITADEVTRLADPSPDTDRSIHTSLPALSSAATGPKTKVDRIWLTLVPCVALPAADRSRLEGVLQAQDATIKRGAVARLTKGTTRLAVALASTEADTEWTLQDLTLSPTDGATTALYTNISLKSGALVADTKVGDKGDHDTSQLIADGLSGKTLHALEIVKNKTGPSFALVEIAYAVPVDAADKALAQKVSDIDKQNQARVTLAKELLGGAVVDLRARLAAGTDGLPPPVALNVGREKLGSAGMLVGTPGSKGDVAGIHVEVFAGKPLATTADVDASKLPSKSVARVAGSPWFSYKDTDASAGALLSGDLARHLIAGLASLKPPVPGFDPKPLTAPPADDKQPWTPSREGWMAFCDNNRRVLSRVLSVHPSEWSLDWPSAALEDDSTHKLQTESMGDALARVHDTLAWMKGVAFDAKEDGLPDLTSLVFHAPTRLVEYLRTGVEVTLTGAGGLKVDSAKVTFTPDDGDAVPLTLGLAHGRYATRLLVSEAAVAAPKVQGTVRVDGLPQPLVFPKVDVVRGATTHLRVVEPWISAAYEWPHDATGYAVDVKHATEAFQGSTLYFLGDGGAHLLMAGYGRMHLTITAFFNDTMPKLSAKTGSPFAVVPRGPQSTPPPASGTEREPKSTTLDIDVFSSANGSSAGGTLTVTAEGGDFPSATTLTWDIKTRVIEKGTVGSDVAQLQLYLSQIMAADGAPCYRASGQREDIADDPNKRAAITIDGHYDATHEGLRHALWRFCYGYARGWGQITIKTSQGGVAATDLAAFAAAHPDALEHPDKVGHPKKDQADLVTYVARTAGRQDKNAEWPVVDGDFVKLLVATFPLGHAIPHADFTFASVVTSFGAPADDGPPVGAPSVTGTTVRPLPLPDAAIKAALSSKMASGADPSEPVEISVPDQGAYRLSRDGSATSATTKLEITVGDVLKGATFYLVAGPALSSHADPENVTAETTGARPWVVGRRQVLPPRDFLKAWGKGDAGYDAARMQFWLSQAPRNPKNLAAAQAAADKDGLKKGLTQSIPVPTRGYVPDRSSVALDGVWTDGWVKALKEYRTDWGGPATSDALVKMLSGPKS